MKKRLLVCLLAFGLPSLAANIVTNPGFENDGVNLVGWSTLSGGWYTSTFLPGSGTYSARTPCAGTNCLGPAGNVLYQDLPTTVAGLYSLTFFADFISGATPNELQVYWDGVLVGDILNSATDGWQQYSFPNLVATTASTRLAFAGRDDVTNIQLDDIFVGPSAALDTSPVPEPATALTAGMALLAVAGWTLCRRHD